MESLDRAIQEDCIPDLWYRFYQTHQGKALTERYAVLNKQLDQVVHQANSEIAALQHKVSGWYSISYLVAETYANQTLPPLQIYNLIKLSYRRRTRS